MTSKFEELRQRHGLPDVELSTLKAYAEKLAGRTLEVVKTKNKRFVVDYTNYNMRGLMPSLVATTEAEALANFIILLSSTSAAREKQEQMNAETQEVI